MTLPTTIPLPAAPVGDEVPATDGPATESADGQLGARCPSCPHLIADHDAIATRFCAATLSLSSSRACVCRAAAVKTVLKPASDPARRWA